MVTESLIQIKPEPDVREKHNGTEENFNALRAITDNSPLDEETRNWVLQGESTVQKSPNRGEEDLTQLREDINHQSEEKWSLKKYILERVGRKRNE